MKLVLSRETSRALDRNATERCGVPSLTLMENAGRGAADRILTEIAPSTRVVVVAGPGNNGGDGYVVARRLLLSKVGVVVVTLASPERLRGDARTNHDAWRDAGGSVRVLSPEDLDQARPILASAEVIVDALFGTGLDRELDPAHQRLIAAINASPARKAALDLPSGLDANTGRAHGAVVRADLTLTFATHKLGLLTPTGAACAGRIELLDIGIPEQAASGIEPSALYLEPADVRPRVPPRPANAHKGASGRVLVLAGSPGKIGAALLVARGALRAGAGLVTLAGVREVTRALDRRVLEAMTAELDPEALEASLEPLLSRADVVAVGPGLGLGEIARRIVDRVVLSHPGPVVVDADALTLLSGRAAAVAGAPGPRVLTPHPGEMGRLLGRSTEDVESDRYGAIERASAETGATVLFKGPHTLVKTRDGTPRVLPAGTPSLATGGAGDVLTGIVAALAVQLAPEDAAWVGAFLHLRAAEIWTRKVGADRGLLAQEIADHVPNALAELAGHAEPLPV